MDFTYQSASGAIQGHHGPLVVYALAFTNMNQSAPNLVKMYVTIRTQMSLVMDVIGPELSELPALELENSIYMTIISVPLWVSFDLTVYQRFPCFVKP